MAANLRFYVDNMFDAATISSWSEATEYPAANMQHTHRTLRWHSTSLSEQLITWDVGAGGKTATYVAVVNPNITSGNLSVKATNNSDYVSDLLLNESFSLSPSIFGYGQDKYGEHGYGGTLLTTEMERYCPGGRVVIYHLDAAIGARYWSLNIPSSCGAEDAFFAVGRVFCGVYYEPAYNPDFGYVLRPIDASVVRESEGGQPWVDIHPQRRELEFNFGTIKQTEAHFNMFDLMYNYGKRSDVLVNLYPDGSYEEQLFNILYGRFTASPGISRHVPDYYQTPGSIVFRESL